MRKLLLITVTAMLFSSSAFADLGSSLFYAKFNLGVNKANPIKQYATKFKSKTASMFMIGIGYNITNHIRTDLTFELLPNTISKASVPVEDEYETSSSSDSSTSSQSDSTTSISSQSSSSSTISVNKYNTDIKRKANMKVLMANVYVDVFDAEIASIFVGAGIGGARMKDILSVKHHYYNNKFSKGLTNFAYHLTLGTAIKVTDRIKAEIAYSWRDYGKVAKFFEKVEDEDARYRSNNLIAGIRFDI